MENFTSDLEYLNKTNTNNNMRSKKQHTIIFQSLRLSMEEQCSDPRNYVFHNFKRFEISRQNNNCTLQYEK